MKKSIREENEQIWKAMVERSKHRAGSVEAFCKAEGVSASAFGYWQNKFRSRPVSPKKAKNLSPFSRVEILEPTSHPPRTSAPNAKWVAEIILYLHRGMNL